jgi:hypothetical protein
MFYELGPRSSVCIHFCANTILMFIYTEVMSGYGTKGWKVAGSISEGVI